MVDQEMLEAMRQLIRAETSSIVEQKMADQEQRLFNNMKSLLENDMQPQINLIAEDVKAIRDLLPKFEEQEALRDDVDILKDVVRIHSEEIQKLKKAQ